MESDLIKVGYWYSKREAHFPMPVAEVNVDHKEEILTYLEEGKRLHSYRGSSECRLCDKDRNGSGDKTDGIYLWPDGLAHYVMEHNIHLPEAFMTHILKSAERINQYG